MRRDQFDRFPLQWTSRVHVYRLEIQLVERRKFEFRGGAWRSEVEGDSFEEEG